MTALKNPHPGDILKHEFLETTGLSQNRLAHAIGVPPNRIHAIVSGARSITADTDLRLCRFFGLSEGYFLRLQNSLRYARGQTPLRESDRQDQAFQGHCRLIIFE